MARYALVDGGNQVQQVVEWDGSTNWAPPAGLTAKPAASAGIGYTFLPDTNTFAAPPAPPAPPEPPRRVRKSVVIQRLHDAGKLAAASSALNSDLYARERWYAPDQPAVHADNAEVIGLLKAIGADPVAILAPE